jgi:hypothetical protein
MFHIIFWYKLTDVSEVLILCPGDGGSKCIGQFIPECIVYHSRRHSSSYSLPLEPDISPKQNLHLCIVLFLLMITFMLPAVVAWSPELQVPPRVWAPS